MILVEKPLGEVQLLFHRPKAKFSIFTFIDNVCSPVGAAGIQAKDRCMQGGGEQSSEDESEIGAETKSFSSSDSSLSNMTPFTFGSRKSARSAASSFNPTSSNYKGSDLKGGEKDDETMTMASMSTFATHNKSVGDREGDKAGDSDYDDSVASGEEKDIDEDKNKGIRGRLEEGFISGSGLKDDDKSAIPTFLSVAGLTKGGDDDIDGGGDAGASASDSDKDSIVSGNETAFATPAATA